MSSTHTEQRSKRFKRVKLEEVVENPLPCCYCTRRMIANAGRPSSNRLDQKFSGRVVCCYLPGDNSATGACEATRLVGRSKVVDSVLAGIVEYLAYGYPLAFGKPEDDMNKVALRNTIRRPTINGDGKTPIAELKGPHAR